MESKFSQSETKKRNAHHRPNNLQRNPNKVKGNREEPPQLQGPISNLVNLIIYFI